jgi:hypothetical protein
MTETDPEIAAAIAEGRKAGREAARAFIKAGATMAGYLEALNNRIAEVNAAERERRERARSVEVLPKFEPEEPSEAEGWQAVAEQWQDTAERLQARLDTATAHIEDLRRQRDDYRARVAGIEEL